MTATSEALIALLKEQGWEEGDAWSLSRYEHLKVEHRVGNELHITNWSRYLS